LVHLMTTGLWARRLLSCLLAVAVFSAPAGARGQAAPDASELTSTQILRLGVEGYVRLHEQQSGRLTFPDEQALWIQYAACRKNQNHRRSRQLPQAKHSQVSQLRRTLEGWEASYLTCCSTDSHSGSIGGRLKCWSAPLREDVLGEVITDLRRPTATARPSAEFAAALIRGEKMVTRWEGMATRWERESSNAGRRAGVKEIRAEAPRLRVQLRALKDIGAQFPVSASTRLARHMNVYMNRLDNWERG
jgi:hypothetical protein